MGTEFCSASRRDRTKFSEPDESNSNTEAGHESKPSCLSNSLVAPILLHPTYPPVFMANSQFRPRRSASRARASKEKVERIERIERNKREQALFMRRVRAIVFTSLILASVFIIILLAFRAKTG